MADIPVVESSDPAELLGVGRRHLAVRDYSSAVTALGQACELLSQAHGQRADQCGEAYFWYGKSLLGLAREESGVLGDGIPQGGEENAEEDAEDVDDEEVDEDNNDEVEKNGEDETKTDEESKTEDVAMSASEDKGSDAKEDKEEPAAEDKPKAAASEAGEATASKTDVDEPSAGPSGECDPDAEGSDAEEEDEVENLQLAWEVLELARDIFLRRGDGGKKELADVYLHLGEVSLESETYDKAVSDMGKSLELYLELHSPDDRRIAETHYQIGLAHSLSNGFDDAISHFKSAAGILEARIMSLEAAATTDAGAKKHSGDPFYSVEGEVKELKELLPEIREKIQDMADYRAEAVRSVRESLGLPSNGPVVNGNGTGATLSSSSAPAARVEPKTVSDISHLVRRKRKPSETDDTPAPKKTAF